MVRVMTYVDLYKLVCNYIGVVQFVSVSFDLPESLLDSFSIAVLYKLWYYEY